MVASPLVPAKQFSRGFLWTVIVLLACMVGVVKWHHNTDVAEYEFQIDSDVYVMNLLGEKLQEQDKYIAALEGIIMSFEVEPPFEDDLIPLPEPIIDIESE